MAASTEPLELRTPWQALVVSYGITVLIAALVAWHYPGARLFLVLLILATVVGVGLRLRSRVTLTAEGLDVVSVRSWRTPWTRGDGHRHPQARAVRAVPGRWSVDSAGSRELLALRGIGGAPDRPQAMADLVESWWRTHGGPAAPEPEVEHALGWDSFPDRT